MKKYLYLFVILVFSSFLINYSKADTTLQLTPVGNGNYADWTGDYQKVDEGISSASCESGDTINTSTNNERESFVVDLSTIPSGSTITGAEVFTADRSFSDSDGGTYTTFVKVDTINSENSNTHTTSSSLGDCTGFQNDFFNIDNVIKNDLTNFEIGVVKLGSSAPANHSVRIGAIAVTITYSIPDTTLPILSLPSDITVEANSHDGAIVNFTATADDINPVNPEVSCTPSSGSTFILGTTTVNCSATDNVGNTADGSFNVIVKDTTPPMITEISLDITTEAVSDSGVNVSYILPTATDIVDGVVVVNCLPTSDSLFPIGENIVNCSAIDNAGNTSSVSFKVTVLEKVKSSTATEKRSGSYLKILPNVPVASTTLKNVVSESVKGEVLGVEKFNFTNDLYFGVKSDEVVELQKFLISKGYLKKGAFGGFFGKYTKEAVKKFQEKNPPLLVDGIVGPYTRAVLNK